MFPLFLGFVEFARTTVYRYTPRIMAAMRDYGIKTNYRQFAVTEITSQWTKKSVHKIRLNIASDKSAIAYCLAKTPILKNYVSRRNRMGLALATHAHMSYFNELVAANVPEVNKKKKKQVKT